MAGSTPKPGIENLTETENEENQNLICMAEMTMENAEIPPSPLQPDCNRSGPIAAVMNLNALLTALHAAFPPLKALLLFSGNCDLRSISTLSARRAEYNLARSSAAGTGSDMMRRNTAEDRAFQEWVVRARIGSSFVGIKT